MFRNSDQLRDSRREEEAATYVVGPGSAALSCNSLWAACTATGAEMERLILPFNSMSRKLSGSCSASGGFASSPGFGGGRPSGDGAGPGLGGGGGPCTDSGDAVLLASSAHSDDRVKRSESHTGTYGGSPCEGDVSYSGLPPPCDPDGEPGLVVPPSEPDGVSGVGGGWFDPVDCA